MKISLNQGHLAALALVALLIIWMLAGLFSAEPIASDSRPLSLDEGLTKVQVERLQGELSARELSFSGVTAAHRRVELRSEIQSKVVAIHKDKGSQVKQGELIIELDKRDLPERVAQAKAHLKQQEIEAHSVRELANKGLANNAQLAQAQTQLANAKAELTRAQVQLNATDIRAPFAGIIDERHVEIGDLVQSNSAIALVLDFSPWLVKGRVAERDIQAVHTGDKAYAVLTNGERVAGVIRFVSTNSDPQTRTFLVEMEVQTPNAKLASGLSARIHVTQPENFSYYLSPALLVLNDQGELGLKGVDAENKVIFLPVQLLGADDKGVWVSGPSADARIITIGQGFVDYGQAVRPIAPSNPSNRAEHTASSVE